MIITKAKMFELLPYSIETNEDNNLTIQVLIPGVKKEDISLEIENLTYLKIEAVRPRPDSGKLAYSNIPYGHLFCRINLPVGESIQLNNCVAEYIDGVLNIFVKMPSLTNKNIPIF